MNQKVPSIVEDQFHILNIVGDQFHILNLWDR